MTKLVSGKLYEIIHPVWFGGSSENRLNVGEHIMLIDAKENLNRTGTYIVSYNLTFIVSDGRLRTENFAYDNIQRMLKQCI